MHNYYRRNSFTKITCISILASGTAWIIYQIKQIQSILQKPLDTDVLDITNKPTELNKEPVYFTLPIGNLPKPKSLWNDFLDSLRYNFAKHLIDLANSENKFIRMKAVRQLAKMKLDDWHFNLLSTLISPETAIGLARNKGVDSRFFAEPPLRYLTLSDDELITTMKNLLISLYKHSGHSCLSYFTDKVFKNEHDMDRLVDHDSTHLELTEFLRNKTSTNVLPMCLESLLHHASLDNYAKDIITFNGLPLLLEIYHRYKDNFDIMAQLSRIISYISVNKNSLDELFKNGLIKILSEWKQYDDVRISVPANKALANLDVEEDSTYYQRLYVLHPENRSTTKPIADVIFVHGLLGSVFFTWRQRDECGFPPKTSNDQTLKFSYIPSALRKIIFKPRTIPKDPEVEEIIEDFQLDALKPPKIQLEDLPSNLEEKACDLVCICNQLDSDMEQTKCWPKDWLPNDLENLRVIGVNYETNLSMWAPICPNEKRRTLDERCIELREQLIAAGVGERPIIWVTHSMGGIMVKNLICQALDDPNKKIENISSNTKGIVFYSTPHIGTTIAQLSQASSYVFWPSVEVQELRRDSEKLLNIHKKFIDVATRLKIKVISFVETRPTNISAIKFKFLIVEPDSGNPGIGEYYEIPQDHLSICKPSSRYSFLYQKVLYLIYDIIEKNKII